MIENMLRAEIIMHGVHNIKIDVYCVWVDYSAQHISEWRGLEFR